MTDHCVYIINICADHQDKAESSDGCPYCTIERLQAENERLLVITVSQHKDTTTLLKRQEFLEKVVEHAQDLVDGGDIEAAHYLRKALAALKEQT